MIPKRQLGKTGVAVTQIGLGGEGVLRSTGREEEARQMIARALELGINYCETARAYADSELYYGRALEEKRREVFLASKAHARTAVEAEAQLRTTLANLRTDWLDLWQLHDLRSEADLQAIFAPGGAIEAFDRAKQAGTVRFIGITGHQDPAILLKALDLYPFDTVLMPVNPAEAAWRSFPEAVLPEAQRRGLGVIGMKVLCRGLGLQVPGQADPAVWLRYALAREVTTVVIGCDDPGQVEANVAAACRPPLELRACRELEGVVSTYARQLMYYK